MVLVVSVTAPPLIVSVFPDGSVMTVPARLIDEPVAKVALSPKFIWEVLLPLRTVPIRKLVAPVLLSLPPLRLIVAADPGKPPEVKNPATFNTPPAFRFKVAAPPNWAIWIPWE